MRYPVPNYAAPAPVAASSGTPVLIIVGIVIAIVVVSLGAIAIGLGVGLGVGLKKDSSSSTSLITNNCVYDNSTCGCAAIQPTLSSTKIINGYDATAHSWPWTVALYNDGSFICGGFLAESYQIVITAAHCLVDFEQSSIRIYAGLQTLSSSADGQYRDVANWKIHPDYSGEPSFENDIAIIKLNSSFDKNDDINLCCLPSGSTQLPTLNEFAVIAGWGTTISGDPSSVSDTLLQAVIQIQGPSTYCDASATSDIQFCAGYGTSDTCQGDSGGPLMTTVNNLWTCTGIVSYGNNGCGHSGYYTRVSYYRSFIDSTIDSL